MTFPLPLLHLTLLCYQEEKPLIPRNLFKKRFQTSKNSRHLGEKLFEKSLSPKNPFSKTFFLKTFLKKGFQTFQKLFFSEPF
ncbi:MAG: hypothetical protein D6805_08660 [Planctomycetota bacterium]|nr:MAG: hypothetical protein D6805_08660 [Planctomycetota bacterium]